MHQHQQHTASADTPFWGKCPTCSHCWVVAYYPIDARTFARVVGGHSTCPKCGASGSVARQDNGVLQEPEASTDDQD